MCNIYGVNWHTNFYFFVVGKKRNAFIWLIDSEIITLFYKYSVRHESNIENSNDKNLKSLKM